MKAAIIEGPGQRLYGKPVGLGGRVGTEQTAQMNMRHGWPSFGSLLTGVSRSARIHSSIVRGGWSLGSVTVKTSAHQR